MIEKINKILQELDNIEPLVDFVEASTKVQANHIDALALMYANENFREYLMSTYNQVVKSSALRSNNEQEMIFNKARALTIKELLIASRNAFLSVERRKTERINNAK